MEALSTYNDDSKEAVTQFKIFKHIWTNKILLIYKYITYNN